MDKSLIEFILLWRWHFKKDGWRGARLRLQIAKKFLAAPGYKAGAWTADMFCSVYDKLKKDRRI